MHIPAKLVSASTTLTVCLFGLFAGLPSARAQKSAFDTLPYNLTAPSRIVYLSTDELVEISGLSPTDTEGEFCAIADEAGVVFFIDAIGGKVKRRVSFEEKGDFEGVEWLQHCIFAIKSNGDLYEIGKLKRRSARTRVHKTPLSKENDIEGLGYDPARNALLIACKENPDSSTVRNIWAFDLETKQLSEKPVYTIHPASQQITFQTNDEGKTKYFSPSGIAVHPLTNDIYVTSSSLKRILVLDHATGRIKYAAVLDKKLLPQPEGIAFDRAGNLYLSSEGKNGEGQVLRFDYRPANIADK